MTNLPPITPALRQCVERPMENQKAHCGVVRGVALMAVGLVCCWPGVAAAQYSHSAQFINNCQLGTNSGPVWLAELGSPPIAPANWELAGKCTTSNQCAANQSCNSNGLCTCASNSDCRGATCQAGVCANSVTLSLGQGWSGRFWGRTGCAGTGASLTCGTGDCAGQLDCNANGGRSANTATLFEPTLAAANGIDFYDVSVASGYNLQLKVTAIPPSDFPVWKPNTNFAGATSIIQAVNGVSFRFYANPGGISGATPPPWPSTIYATVQDNQIVWQNFGGLCGTAGCSSDLNLTCPNSLKQRANDGTVIGCNNPCNVCTGNSNAPGLNCLTTVSTNGTFQDMYCCKNLAQNTGISMQSGLGGSAICFNSSDCPVGTTCAVNPVLENPLTLPDAGVCVPAEPKGCTPGSAGAKCSDFPFVNYTCNNVTSGNQPVCLPPTTTGLGVTYPNPVTHCTTTSDCVNNGACVNNVCQPTAVYTGTCGLFNADWVAAGRQAGTNGQPYYQIFRNACPTAYAWQFDDDAGTYVCNNTAQPTNYVVTFCPSGGLGATPPPTPPPPPPSHRRKHRHHDHDHDRGHDHDQDQDHDL